MPADGTSWGSIPAENNRQLPRALHTPRSCWNCYPLKSDYPNEILETNDFSLHRNPGLSADSLHTRAVLRGNQSHGVPFPRVTFMA